MQLANYSIYTMSTRAAALGLTAWAMFLDAVYAGFVYFIYKEIAKKEGNRRDEFVGWLGYVVGSVLGTGSGILITKYIFGR